MARFFLTFLALQLSLFGINMLGVVQQWAGIEYGLKYVNRKGRDQVVQVSGKTLGEPSTDPTLASNYTTYTNDGKSETDTYTLTVGGGAVVVMDKETTLSAVPDTQINCINTPGVVLLEAPNLAIQYTPSRPVAASEFGSKRRILRQ